MNLSDLNKTITLAANVGVLAGIVFLAVEVNQNTRATDVEANWSRSMAATEIYEGFRGDPQLVRTWFELSQRSQPELKQLTDQMADIFYGRSVQPQEVSEDIVQMHRIVLQMAVERAYWNTRYLVDTTEEQRAQLHNLIADRLSNPVLKIALDINTASIVDLGFESFLQDIVKEIEAKQ